MASGDRPPAGRAVRGYERMQRALGAFGPNEQDA